MNVASYINEGITLASNHIHNSMDWDDIAWEYINSNIDEVQKEIDRLSTYEQLLKDYFNTEQEMDLDELWNRYRKLAKG
ncbi:MAG: hypothetical protein PHY47_01045 [Lachnospiraceae bacterium]|nr:hypothetical protein [Lachnospiraceae bacterium]